MIDGWWGGHTAINKVVDLLLGHADTFRRPKSALLLLSPLVNVKVILGVAVEYKLASLKARHCVWGSRRIHMYQRIQLASKKKTY